MALIDLFSHMVTDEDGRSIEEDLPLVREGLDNVLQLQEKGRSVDGGRADQLLYELQSLFQGVGIEANVGALMRDLRQKRGVPEAKVKLLEEGLNAWIIRNKTRLDALDAIQ